MKNTDSAGSKGYDPGKKVSGIKRHVAVDSQGLPHAIHVTTAGVTDRAGALAMFGQRRAELSEVRNVMVDGGYTGKPFAVEVENLLGASVEVVKRVLLAVVGNQISLLRSSHSATEPASIAGLLL